MLENKSNKLVYISGISSSMARRIAKNEFELFLKLDVNEQENRFDVFLKVPFREMNEKQKNQLEQRIKSFENKWEVFHVELLDTIKLK